MKRKTFVMIELLLIICIFIGILGIVFSTYFLFKESGKTVVNVNDDNRETIEKLLQESEKYDHTYNIYDLKKIQYFLDFNDFEFTLFYQDGVKKELHDDNLDDLKSYIEKNGYSKTMLYVGIDIGILIICIGANALRKKIAKEIENKEA